MPEITKPPEISAQTPQAPKRRIRFRDYAVDQFDPDIVIRRLASPGDRTKWRSPVLFRGFIAWVLDNQDRTFVRDSMVRYIGDRLARREMKLRKKYESQGRNPALSYLALPGQRDLIPLFDEAFEPFGGLSSIMYACSLDELDQIRQSRVDDAKSVIDLMSVFHLYAITGGKVPHPSTMNIEFACTLVEELQKKRAEANLVTQALKASSHRKHWNRLAESSALIYAAWLLEYQRKSLFDILFARSSQYSPKRVSRWFKLAKKISEDVCTACTFQEGKVPQFVIFPKKPKPMNIPPPELRLCEALWLVWQFQQDPKEREWGDVIERIEFYARTGRSIAQQCSHNTVCAACKAFTGEFDDDMRPMMRSH